MHIVALVTQKGGSGKSTLAVGLAVAALEQGQRVGLIDAGHFVVESNPGEIIEAIKKFL